MEKIMNEHIVELETDYEIVYRDYVDPIVNVVPTTVEPPVGEKMEVFEDFDNEEKPKKPLFTEAEIEIIHTSSLFGSCLFCLYILVHV